MPFSLRAASILALAGVAGSAALACSIAGEEDNFADESALTGDRTLSVGTCTLETVPTELRAFAPVTETHVKGALKSRAATPDQVLTKVELTAKVKGEGKDRKIEAFEAKVVRGADPGTALLLPGVPSATMSISVATWQETLADGSLAERKGRAYEARYFETLNPEGSSITIGGRSVPVGGMLVHWESSGEQYVIFEKKDAPANELIAIGSSCTFDVTTWKLLRDVGCEDELYAADGTAKPVPEGRPSKCQRAPKDTFARFAASLEAGFVIDEEGLDGGADADAAADATADADATAPDASKPDGSRPDASKPPKPDAATTEVEVTGDDDDDDYPELPEGETKPTSPKSPAKKKKPAASGCAVVMGSDTSTPIEGLVVGLAILGGAVRRRRRR